jgi:hypothetical protein
MPQPLRLEEFESPLEPVDAADASQLVLEEVRLEAFESGYRAGWDDAMTAQAEEQNRLRAIWREICRRCHSPISRRAAM